MQEPDFKMLARGLYQEKPPVLDVRGGKTRWSCNLITHIPNSVMDYVAYRIHSEGEGKISGFAAYKIALEHTRTFIATTLETGGEFVESAPGRINDIHIYYNPTRNKAGHYKLWGSNEE